MKNKTSTCLVVVAALLGNGCAQASGKQAQAPKPAGTVSAQTSGSAAKPAGITAAAPAAEKKSIATLVKPTKKSTDSSQSIRTPPPDP